MKAIFYTDAHIHNFNFGASVDDKTGRHSRLQNGLDVLDMTLEAVKSTGAEARFFIGDMTHVRGTMKPSIINPIIDHHKNAHGNMFSANFMDYLVVGNHDMEHRVEGEHSLHPLSGHNVSILEDHGYTQVAFGDFLLGIGWVAYETNILRLKEKVAAVAALKRSFDEDTSTPNAEASVFLLHHGVDGAMPNIPEMGFGPLDLPHGDFDMMFCGDYHTHKELIKDKAWMVGAPMQHTFGDAGQKRGYMVVDFKNKTTEFIENKNAPKFVTCDKTSGSSEIWSDEVINPGDFVRLRSDDEDWLLMKSKEVTDIGAAAVKQEFIQNIEISAKTDVSLSMTTSQMFGTWVEGQELPDGILKDELVALNDEILKEVGA